MIRENVLPASSRPGRLEPSLKLSRRSPPPPRSLVAKAYTWISDNRTAVACALAFTGTTVWLIHRRRRHRCRRRRARKNANGSKREVVILAGTYHDPLCRSVALDLYRRGYIVYVTVSSASEEKAIYSEKIGLQPLWMDLTSAVPSPGTDVHPNFLPVQNLLRSRPTSSPSQNPHPFTLAGLVLLPSLSYPSGPLAATPPSTIIDTANTHLLSPIVTLQQYLTLHQRLLLSQSNAPSPTIVLATPSIAASLPTSNNPLETALSTALRSLLPGLRQSLPSTPIVDLRIGNIDLSTVISRTLQTHSPSSTAPNLASQLSLPWHWHPSTHTADLQSYFASTSATPVRELHNAIFDALLPARDLKLFGSRRWRVKGRKETVTFVGRGARIYDIVGRLGLGLGWRWALPKGSWDSESGTASKHQPPARNEEEGDSGLWEKVYH